MKEEFVLKKTTELAVISTAFLPGLIGVDLEDFRSTLSIPTATGNLLHTEAARIDLAAKELVQQKAAAKLAQTKRAVITARVAEGTSICALSDAVEILAEKMPDTADVIFGAVQQKEVKNQASIHCIIMI